MFRFFVCAAALFYFGSNAFGSAQEAHPVNPADAGVFSVSAFVYEDGVLLGTPTLTLREGEPGVVAVSGNSGFALELTVASAIEETFAMFGQTVEGGVSVRSELFFPDMVEDQWNVVATPQLLTQPGQRARAEVDIYSRGYQRPQSTEYSDNVSLELIVSEVSEAWLQSRDGRKSITTCTIETIDGPKSMERAGAIRQAVVSIGDPDDNCCTTGCLTCCNACCSDPANCPTGCCAQ